MICSEHGQGVVMRGAESVGRRARARREPHLAAAAQADGDRCEADRAGAAVHQHALAGPQAPAHHQRIVPARSGDGVT
jgi:hypothetical protein